MFAPMETMNYAAIPSARGPEEKEDLGFGAVVSSASRKRLLNADGTFNVWNTRFTNIFNPPDAEGVMSLDISRLDETQPAT